MALWSLTSLTQNSSKHVANPPLSFCEDKSIYRLPPSICVYHLSSAFILTSVLVKFSTICSTKLRIQSGDSDSDCEEYEDHLPIKAVALLNCKQCQESGDHLNKAVTQSLLVCWNKLYLPYSSLLTCWTYRKEKTWIQSPHQKQITGKTWHFDMLKFTTALSWKIHISLSP